MEFNIIPDSEALRKCAWCRDYISDDMEVFGLGAKLDSKVDLSEYEGHCIQIDLVSASKPVYMIVTAPDSDAKNDGKDGMFLVCSEKCLKKLKNSLEKDIALGQMFKTVL